MNGVEDRVERPDRLEFSCADERSSLVFPDRKIGKPCQFDERTGREIARVFNEKNRRV